MLKNAAKDETPDQIHAKAEAHKPHDDFAWFEIVRQLLIVLLQVLKNEVYIGLVWFSHADQQPQDDGEGRHELEQECDQLEDVIKPDWWNRAFEVRKQRRH